MDHAPGVARSLADPAVRAAATARLGGLYAGRPVIVGPGILAANTPMVHWLRGLGCRVLVVSTARGAGEVPRPDECEVVEISAPAVATVTDELRALDRLARSLPDHAVAAIEAFDPERRGVWHSNPFVTTDQPILGRPVAGGRPAAFLALEDKLLAEQVWDAAGVPTAPHHVVPVEREALARATAELAGPLGVVWSGDARDGFNGGGNYVRWVCDKSDQAEAHAFFVLHCDRVRVLPFLDGVPCSIHGFVLPDGTAALRPVEIAILRDVAHRRFVYGGLSSFWDPPPDDREGMRAAVRRVGAHLQTRYGYRGGFGIDGVLTADGFRPTELNTRMSAGATTVGEVDREFFTWLQSCLVADVDTGLTVADVESLVPLMDAERTGKVAAVAEGAKVGPAHEFPVAYDGGRLRRATNDTGILLALADTPTGFFARLDAGPALARGDRLAPLNVALMSFLDREYAAGFGAVSAARDLR